jgi:hypothetical protein
MCVYDVGFWGIIKQARGERANVSDITALSSNWFAACGSGLVRLWMDLKDISSRNFNQIPFVLKRINFKL